MITIENLFSNRNNLINQSEIIFGKNITTGGVIIDSTQMYVMVDPAPDPGIYTVSGILNFSVFAQANNGTWTNITRTIVEDYFTFMIPEPANGLVAINKIALNLAAYEEDWWRGDIVYMNKGNFPIRKTKSTLDSSSILEKGNLFSMPKDPSEGETFYNKSFNCTMVFTNGKWEYAGVPQKYAPSRQKIIDWKFSGGSLVMDGIEKSTGLVINSEVYVNNTSYTIDVLSSGDIRTSWLKFIGIHLLEFTEEIVEFTVNRSEDGDGSYFGIAYVGETLLRKLYHYSCVSRATSGIFSIRHASGGSFSLNMFRGIGNIVGRKFRITHQFYGEGERAILHDLTNDNFLVSILDFKYINGFPQRPNNHAFGFAINNIGVTITKFEVYNMEGERSNLTIIGDSISATRIASLYEKGYSKLITKWNGPGSFLHAGGSNTTRDLINAIDDTLKQNPKIIIVATGTNDINNNIATRYDDFTELINILSNSDARIIISNVIPADSTDMNRWVRILDFNTWLQTNYASTLTIVDQFSALVNVGGTDWNLLYRGDELHPNDLGHEIMFNELKKYL